MKKVLLRSPLLTQSGYGVHARQIGKWLLTAQEQYKFELKTELLNWGMTHWITNLDEDLALLVQASHSPYKFYDVTLQLQLPNEWDTTLGLVNIGFTAGVETTVAPKAWGQAVNKMSLVVVPSEFTKKGLVAAGAQPEKIIVIPESFPDLFLDESKAEKLDLDLKTPFNFLCIGQMTGNNVDNDRKNIPRTLELFARTFEGNRNVGLVVKTNFGSNSKLDQRHTKNVFMDMIEKIGGNGPSFYLLHGPMTDGEMFGLYTHPSIKCMLSLTRGEGFGLPLLEAAACGLPVIATQWSAHTEFLDKGFWLPIQSDLENVHPTRIDDYFIKEAKWAAPNMEVASARLKKFYAKSETPRILAKELQKEIKQQYSEKIIQKIYNEKLGDQLK